MDQQSNEFDRKELEAWLEKQPPEVSVALAARAALRALPLIGSQPRNAASNPLLYPFRANSLLVSYLGWPDTERDKLRLVAKKIPLIVARQSSEHFGAHQAHVLAVRSLLSYSSISLDIGFPPFSAETTIGTAPIASRTVFLTPPDARSFTLTADRQALEKGLSPQDLVASPLWPEGQMPEELARNWEELKTALLSRKEDWDVWTDWYEDRLHGRPLEDPALALARVTLPEPMWGTGAATVNAEIRSLIALNQKGGAEAVEARMAELRETWGEEDNGTGEPVGDLADPMEADESGSMAALEDPAAAPGETLAADLDALPKAWLLQYTPENRVARWVREAGPGSTLNWKSGKALPKALQAGDPVVYWRAVDPDNKGDRGGVVGTGKVLSTEVVNENGINRFPTEVRQFDEARRIDQDEAIEEAGLSRKNFRGAVLSLPPEEAVALDRLLRRKKLEPIYTDAQLLDAGVMPPIELEDDPETETAQKALEEDKTPGLEGEVRVRRDDAERDTDALGRGPLAVSLATILHEIWCAEQGFAPFPARRPQADAAGFVAHIDAPWGGGKTSFANLIARVLNPDLDSGTAEADAATDPKHLPVFLSELYPDRADMSGLFIKDTVEPFGLKDGDGHYKWDHRARRPWIVIPFNAWLNQHMEPPWWSFYQTIRQGCFKAIRREGVPIIRQKRDGTYETHRENRLNRFDRLRGLWLRELWWRLTTPKVRSAFYTFCLVVLVSLLLGAFGLFDLNELKKAFSAANAAGTPLSSSKVISTAAMVLLGGASAVWSMIATATQSLLPGTPEAAKNYSLGSSDPLNRFRKHFARMMEAVERPVLVVIDDIDRCDPKFIVEMTRGLQTILKSPRVVYLLLGDKNWIEQAFEVCHKDMSGIDVGPEHSFGGRFVEKAVQLSYILPGIGDKLDDYVSTVLIGRSAQEETEETVPELPAEDNLVTSVEVPFDASPTATPGVFTEAWKSAISPNLLNQIRFSISQGETLEEIDQLASQTAQDIERSVPRADRRRALQEVRNTVILRRTAKRRETEDAIRHRLQPLGGYLPGNPRHIKRIINAVSMYQNSLVVFEEEQSRSVVGGKRWRQLVIGVVLMIGYPKSWRLLAAHPAWADELMKEAPEFPNPGGGTGGSPEEQAFNGLAGNRTFLDLMKNTSLRDMDDKPQPTHIDAEAVDWLNRIIPAA